MPEEVLDKAESTEDRIGVGSTYSSWGADTWDRPTDLMLMERAL